MPDPLPPLPEARTVARKRTRLSPVWIVPIVAAIAGVWVAVTRILSEGPEITITMRSAEGLEAGKTKIQYNGVEVGTITAIRLSEDHRRVIATAQMEPKTDGFLLEDTQFWVVRPRISGANISGLGTLISGAYIGMDIGASTRKRRDFVALENPPVVTADVPGRYFVLSTADLGSLDTGTPIFFRRLQVGEVASYKLQPGGNELHVKIFVNAPYDQYVTPNTRFWQASGIDVSLSASGLSIQTQSILSILIGGLAFETPSNGPVLPAAEPDTQFTLFDTRAAAFKVEGGDPQTFELIFTDSLRGLTPGAPVEFRGIPIGEVAAINAHVDARTMTFTAPVTIRIDALQFGVKVTQEESGQNLATIRKQVLDNLIAQGARAQLQSGNLLTGALFVSFDFFPDAPPASVDWSQTPPRIPTIPGQLEAVEARLGNIVKKIDELPLKAIGNDLQKTLVQLDATLASARGTLDSGRGTLENASRLIEPNSALGAELGNTLQEVSRAARSVRVLADYLERHPEALIRGKPGEAQ